jgi:hypothetical protein
LAILPEHTTISDALQASKSVQHRLHLHPLHIYQQKQKVESTFQTTNCGVQLRIRQNSMPTPQTLEWRPTTTISVSLPNNNQTNKQTNKQTT